MSRSECSSSSVEPHGDLDRPFIISPYLTGSTGEIPDDDAVFRRSSAVVPARDPAPVACGLVPHDGTVDDERISDFPLALTSINTPAVCANPISAGEVVRDDAIDHHAASGVYASTVIHSIIIHDNATPDHASPFHLDAASPRSAVATSNREPLKKSGPLSRTPQDEAAVRGIYGRLAVDDTGLRPAGILTVIALPLKSMSRLPEPV